MGIVAPVPADLRQDYCVISLERLHSANPVTLDGMPAIIRGAFLPFAKVARADGRGGDVEYSWFAVANVLAKGGKFIS